MPRKPSRFVKDLTDDKLNQLQFYIDHGKTPRIRHRAHAIRLSYQGKMMNQIAEIFGIDRDTVAHWLDRWEQFGEKGSADKPRPGPTPKLDESERELALDLWKKNRHAPKQVLDEFEKLRKKRISLSTMKRLVQASTRYRPRKPK